MLTFLNKSSYSPGSFFHRINKILSKNGTGNNGTGNDGTGNDGTGNIGTGNNRTGNNGRLVK